MQPRLSRHLDWRGLHVFQPSTERLRDCLAYPCYNSSTFVSIWRGSMSTTIIMAPDIQQKLAILGSEASEEVTDVPATQSIQQGITHATGFIYNAKQEGGGTSRLFKVLQTNACRYSC